VKVVTNWVIHYLADRTFASLDEPYRQIEVMAGCSHRAIARARRVLDAERLSTAAQIEALTVEDLTLLQEQRHDPPIVSHLVPSIRRNHPLAADESNP
jgi:hypothetical protein